LIQINPIISRIINTSKPMALLKLAIEYETNIIDDER